MSIKRKKSWSLSLRRIAGQREGRRTKLIAQLTCDQRTRFTDSIVLKIIRKKF